jgi:hypothetical protein
VGACLGLQGLCAAADLTRSPTATQKIFVRGVIRCVLTATGSKCSLRPCLNSALGIRSRDRGAATGSRGNRVVGGISLGGHDASLCSQRSVRASVRARFGLCAVRDCMMTTDVALIFLGRPIADVPAETWKEFVTRWPAIRPLLDYQSSGTPRRSCCATENSACD